MNQKKTFQSLKNIHVAVISAGWHADIVNNAVGAIRSEFKRAGLPPKALELFPVPGVFEIPLHAKRLAQTGRYDAVIACGFVVNGGIYRHEFVSAAVVDALMQVQLAQDIPVFSAVLTPHNFQESPEHETFFKAHFVKKGQEVARACLETVTSLRKIKTN